MIDALQALEEERVYYQKGIRVTLNFENWKVYLLLKKWQVTRILNKKYVRQFEKKVSPFIIDSMIREYAKGERI